MKLQNRSGNQEEERLEKLRYPVGHYAFGDNIPKEQLEAWIEEIASLPVRLEETLAALSAIDRRLLDTPYREGGWTPRQVVHHLADSHMNSFIRMKLALTEEHPTIKPYREDAWAELADSRTADIGLSLQLLTALHARWSVLLRNLTEADYRRTFAHPESGSVDLANQVGLYAWHGRHHLAHIAGLLPPSA